MLPHVWLPLLDKQRRSIIKIWGDIMYTVIFIRRDDQPDEIYYYNHLDEARHHFELFRDDDSELYNRIELVQENRIMKMQIDVINFVYQ